MKLFGWKCCLCKMETTFVVENYIFCEMKITFLVENIVCTKWNLCLWLKLQFQQNKYSNFLVENYVLTN